MHRYILEIVPVSDLRIFHHYFEIESLEPARCIRNSLWTCQQKGEWWSMPHRQTITNPFLVFEPIDCPPCHPRYKWIVPQDESSRRGSAFDWQEQRLRMTRRRALPLGCLAVMTVTARFFQTVPNPTFAHLQTTDPDHIWYICHPRMYEHIGIIGHTQQFWF